MSIGYFDEKLPTRKSSHPSLKESQQHIYLPTDEQLQIANDLSQHKSYNTNELHFQN